MEELVKIIIPVYKVDLSLTETVSLRQTLEVFKNYPKVLVKPQSLNVDCILEKYGPELQVESFNDRYFDGVAGYNKLMLSREFYERFLDTEYILICQLDVFVFRDELSQWCNKGYDYIGAPWILKFKYNRLYYQLFLRIKNFIYSSLELRGYHDILNKVGNGGFSLRKVNAHYEMLLKMEAIAAKYVNNTGSKRYNEDVFWAVEVTKRYRNFKTPDWREALKFAFDVQPRECFYYNNNRLPFGVHGWNIRLEYYESIINKYIEESEKKT